ncbi:MAG: Fur family transcriptional regulator [Pseudomonadota bacterium]
MTRVPETTPALTRNEERVLAALAGAERPQKAYDLLETLKPQGVKAPMTVYRALDGLTEKGLVHKIDALNAYIVCESDHAHDHASQIFVICRNCGDAREVDDCGVEARVKDVAEANAFALADARLEISGLCAACRGAAS